MFRIPPRIFRMKTLMSLIVIIIAGILLYIYFVEPESNLSVPIHAQGVRLNISLDELFNKVIPSQKVDVAAILDANHNIVWSHTVQLNLSSEYYTVSTYIIILNRPVELELDAISIYQKEVTERFEFILKRTNVFMSLTDVNGKDISTGSAYLFKFGFFLLFGVFAIAAILYTYLEIVKKSTNLKGK